MNEYVVCIFFFEEKQTKKKKRTWVRTFSRTRQLQVHVLFRLINLHISLLDPTEQVRRMRGCFVLSQLLCKVSDDECFFVARCG